MTGHEVLEYLEGLEPLDIKAGEEHYDCPDCDDEDGHFRVNRKKGIYHCFKCGIGGRLSTLNLVPKDKTFTSLDSHGNRVKVEVQSVEELLSTLTLERVLDTSSGMPGVIYDYFNSRGLTESDMNRYNLSAVEEEGPYWDRGLLFWAPTPTQTPQYFVARGVLGSSHPRYLNPPNPKNFLWTTFSLNQVPSRMVFIEGALDAIRVSKIKPAGGILGSQLSHGQIEFIASMVNRGLKEVDILLDRPKHRKINRKGRRIANELDKTMEIYNQIKDIVKARPLFLEHASDPGAASLDYLSDLLN